MWKSSAEGARSSFSIFEQLQSIDRAQLPKTSRTKDDDEDDRRDHRQRRKIVRPLNARVNVSSSAVSSPDPAGSP